MKEVSVNNEEKLKEVIREVFKDELRLLYVVNEEHYLDHQFVRSVRQKAEECKSTFWRTLITSFTLLILGGVAVVVYYMKCPLDPSK